MDNTQNKKAAFSYISSAVQYMLKSFVVHGSVHRRSTDVKVPSKRGHRKNQDTGLVRELCRLLAGLVER